MAGMKTSRRWLAVVGALAVAVILLTVFLFTRGGPARAKEFATLHVLEGSVEVQEGPGGSFTSGTEGQTLRAGDTVRTGTNGRAQITYFDGSLTRLDHDTTFQLKELASIPDVSDSKVIKAHQEEGQTFQRVEAITDSQSRVDVETPTATASVQGTTYALYQRPDGSFLLVVLPDDEPGTSEVIVILPDGTQIPVMEGEQLIVFPDGTTQGPEPADIDEDWILFNLCELEGQDIPECQEEEPQPKPKPNPEPSPSFDVTGGGTTGGTSAPVSDDTAPVATITDGPPRYTDSHSATFRFEANEPASFECRRDGQPFSDCTSPKTYNGVGEGDHTFRVRAIDGAGNVGPVDSRTWTVDTVDPVVTIDCGPDTCGGVDRPGQLGGFSYEFQFSSNEYVTFRCKLDGEAFRACDSATHHAGSDSGPVSCCTGHTFTVKGTDRAGNVGTDSDTWCPCGGRPQKARTERAGPVPAPTPTPTPAGLAPPSTEPPSEPAGTTESPPAEAPPPAPVLESTPAQPGSGLQVVAEPTPA